MAYYYVESRHTAEECLAALDEILKINPRLLNSFWFGCNSGDHTGRATLEARSEEAIRDMIPSNQQKTMYIIQVEKYTPEQIRAFHDE